MSCFLILGRHGAGSLHGLCENRYVTAWGTNISRSLFGIGIVVGGVWLITKPVQLITAWHSPTLQEFILMGPREQVLTALLGDSAYGALA